LTEEETKKDDEFAKFVQDTVRGPKRGILETSICQHLALSINCKPLNSIYHICSAALKLMSEERQKLEINMEELETLFTVTLAFLNALKLKKKYVTDESYWHIDYETQEYCAIIWGFKETLENYKKYVEPWNQLSKFIFAPIVIPLHTKESLEALDEEEEEIKKKIQELTDQLAKQTEKSENLEKQLDALREDSVATWRYIFFTISKYLSLDAFAELQNHFLNWALPKAQVIFNKLSSHVNPDVYSRVLELYVKKGEGKEEISEAQL
jgi:hypothetical protein